MSVVFKKPNIIDEFHQNQNLEKEEETFNNWKQNSFDDFVVHSVNK